ncbi:MAG: SAM-dependent methyltransferase [Chitinophagaceae bacterium]|nr:MAG: SAM-dependent methyltransferase [Chitinophagaceae bacterium]
MKELNPEFWNERYATEQTGWDLGMVSPPLKKYFDQLTDKQLKILVPGAGNAYEVEYLYKKGFKNIFLLDWAILPLKKFKERNPDFPEKQLLQKDFFKLSGEYDLIIEQTFFCALPPSMRESYSQKIYQLLKPNAKLVGLLFQIPLNTDKPPFGGSKEEYIDYFSPFFEFITFETAKNSHPARIGNEIFMILKKRTLSNVNS